MNKQQGFSKLYDTINNYGYDENEKLQIGKHITKRMLIYAMELLKDARALN